MPSLVTVLSGTQRQSFDALQHFDPNDPMRYEGALMQDGDLMLDSALMPNGALMPDGSLTLDRDNA